MIPSYEQRNERLYMLHRASRHVPPHLHSAAEFVYVTGGTLEFGMGQELYHMEKGDFAVAFPEVIHHYQVLSPGNNRAYYLTASPVLCGQFKETMQKYCPKDPVIKKEQVHPEIVHALRALLTLIGTGEPNLAVAQAYMQIIVARSMPCFQMIEKSKVASGDLIYQTVSYVARNFREELSLEMMARDLGVSKYALSRVFSGTFHRNFNKYVNEQRLEYVSTLLECSDRTITEICMDAGFESQRTFNRAFREKYKMTPRQYRKLCRGRYLAAE